MAWLAAWRWAWRAVPTYQPAEGLGAWPGSLAVGLALARLVSLGPPRTPGMASLPGGGLGFGEATIPATEDRFGSSEGQIECRERLGGLLKHYRRVG